MLRLRMWSGSLGAYESARVRRDVEGGKVRALILVEVVSGFYIPFLPVVDVS